jgi:hypothetical protein
VDDGRRVVAPAVAVEARLGWHVGWPTHRLVAVTVRVTYIAVRRHGRRQSSSFHVQCESAISSFARERSCSTCLRTQDIALLWEGRLKNVIVGLGVASNLSSGTKPIKSFGLELSYFSSGSRKTNVTWGWCICSIVRNNGNVHLQISAMMSQCGCL